MLEPTDHDQPMQTLDHLFTPYIRVIPQDDWSSIQAMWIPLLHHDYLSQMERNKTIIIDQKITDRFGSVQGYLSAPNENYLPYITSFFNPTWTQQQIFDAIKQAEKNIIEICQTITDSTGTIMRIHKIGQCNNGMLIQIIVHQNHTIIDAYPIFNKVSQA